MGSTDCTECGKQSVLTKIKTWKYMTCAVTVKTASVDFKSNY